MRLSPEVERLLPGEEDVAFYEEHGYYVTPKVLPDAVIDAAIRGAERHWAGERDWRLPVGGGFGDWKPGDGDTIRNSEYTALQNREIRALVQHPIIGRSPAASPGPARSGSGTTSSSRSRPRPARAGPSSAGTPTALLDDVHVRGYAHRMDPAARLSRRDGTGHLCRRQPPMARQLTALVTGGSKGLGKAMARALAEAGASVAISSRHEDELKSAAAEIAQELHATIVPLAADMTHRGEVKRLAERATAALGKVDILINNAGGNVPQPIDQITDEIWDHFVELNLSSCMALTRALVPQMKDRKWGRFIHISSIMGLHFDPRAQRLLRDQKRPVRLLNRAHTDEFHGRSAPEICRSDGVGPLWRPQGACRSGATIGQRGR